jgi:pimeloyl-ACP methyl ester carboxylesterase
MPEFRMINGDAGVRLRAAVEGAGPLVLMVHGFPESWYSWRHQLGPVAAAGYTACAIDVRGYGGSDRPHPVEAYSMAHIVADLVAVADALAPGAPAILVGHDWGAPIVWNAALTRADRFRAVAALSIPYLGVPPRPPTEIFDALFTQKNRFFYQAYFQPEGVAEAELERDPRDFIRRFLYNISGDVAPGRWPVDKPANATLLEGLENPAVLPAWLTEADLDYYTAEFTRSGFRGPLNRYRNHERDWEWLQPHRGRRIEQPALFIGGTRDLAFNMFGAGDPIASMRKLVPDLRGADMIEGCGHWTQQEKPAEVNERLLGWLQGL